jgi:hypothetical protein
MPTPFDDRKHHNIFASMDLQGNTLLSENNNTINITEVEMRKAKLKSEINQCLKKLEVED